MAEQNLETIDAIYRNATACNSCFAAGHLKRSFVDIAQPRFVGRKYWTAQRRLVFISINPGAGNGSAEDQRMRGDIHAFASGELGLNILFDRQREFFPTWGRGKFSQYFQKIGIDFEEIALLNIAQCATEGDKYPQEMLKSCMTRHTAGLIAALRPDVIVACGQRVQEIATKMHFQFVGIPHYAARTRIDFAQVRRLLESLDANPDSLRHEQLERPESRRVALKTQSRVIRLLEPTNPKSGMSRHRYDCYRDGMTVEEYVQSVSAKCGVIEAKKCMADLKWDSERSYIRLETV